MTVQVLDGFEIHTGSQWACLSRELCRYLIHGPHASRFLIAFERRLVAVRAAPCSVLSIDTCSWQRPACSVCLVAAHFQLVALGLPLVQVPDESLIDESFS